MKTTHTLSLAALLAAIPVVSYADPVPAVGHVSANVVAPLTLLEHTQMDFGSFSPTGSTGTVPTTGSASGVVTLSPPTPAQFDVTGSPGGGYTVTLDATPISLSDGHSHTMSADILLPAMTTRTLSAGGADNFAVNGTLHVGANQTGGNYAGTYGVNVDY